MGYLSDPVLRARVEAYVHETPPTAATRYTVSLDDPPSTRWHHVAPLFRERAKAITAYFEEFLPPKVVPVIERIAGNLKVRHKPTPSVDFGVLQIKHTFTPSLTCPLA